MKMTPLWKSGLPIMAGIVFLHGVEANAQWQEQRAANEWTREWVLRAKTGWGASTDPGIGWWVGWVEWPEGPVFFALNIDMPNGIDDTAKRKFITRDVLRSVGALPKSDQEKHQ